MKRRYKKKPVLVESTADARLLNRYVAHVVYKRFDTSRGRKHNHVVLETKKRYQVQWDNIKSDLLGLVGNPFAVSPRVAYSLAAFLFILLGDHDRAVETAFFMGSVSYDAAAQTNHSGEPSTITWSHTIGSGTDRLININVNGLSTPNAPKWDSNTTTSINSVGATKTAYYLNPSTGAANCTCDGGNIKVGGSISFEGVDQTDPIGATTTENGSSSPNDMSLTTEEDDSMRVDVLGANRDDSSSPTGSLDSGDLRCNDIVPQNQFRIGLFAYTNFQATAGADTHQWTTSGFNRYYSAFEIKASVSGTNTNDERSATLTGGVESNDSRNATTYGQDTSNSERNATVEGQDTSNSERNATLWGKQGDNDERNAVLSGQDTDSDERGGVLHGQDLISSIRDANLWGQDSDVSERPATTHGADTSNSERDSVVHGRESTQAERQGVVWGKDSTSSDRGAVTDGIEGSNSEKNAIIHGISSESSEVNSVLHGKIDVNDSRDAVVHGQDSSSDERLATLWGADVSASVRDAIIDGILTANSEKSAVLSGLSSAYSELLATIWGSSVYQDERFAVLDGVLTSYSEKLAILTGSQGTNSERSAVITGIEVETISRSQTNLSYNRGYARIKTGNKTTLGTSRYKTDL